MNHIECKHSGKHKNKAWLGIFPTQLDNSITRITINKKYK